MLTIQQTPRMIQDPKPENRFTMEAFKLFEQARDRGYRKRLWARLRNRSRALCRLDAVSRQQIAAQHAAGKQEVLLDRIMGSAGRGADFDHDFYPLRDDTQQRWVGIATALLRGQDLPPVELVQVDDVYYVVDGHHRVSVARMLGHLTIDAQVTVWETE